MSMRALLLAVRDTLKTTATTPISWTALTQYQCEVMVDGMPPPMAPEMFWSVWPGSISSMGQTQDSLNELYGCTVTLSMRLTKEPYDKWGVNGLTRATTGLLVMAEATRAVLHMNYGVCASATSLARTTVDAADNEFCEPLSFSSAPPVRKVGGSWWQSTEGEPLAGIVMDLNFGGARRTQRFDIMS